MFRLAQMPYAMPLSEYRIPVEEMSAAKLARLSEVSFQKSVLKRAKEAVNADVRPGVPPLKRERDADGEGGRSSRLKMEPRADPAPGGQEQAVAAADARREAPVPEAASSASVDDDHEDEDDANETSTRELRRAEKRGKAICSMQNISNAI